MNNEIQKFPRRLREAASKRTAENIAEFLAQNPQYKLTNGNKELFRDFLAKAGVVVPSVAALDRAMKALHGELELAEEATAMRVISLKGTGPRVRKVAFSL